VDPGEKSSGLPLTSEKEVRSSEITIVVGLKACIRRSKNQRFPEWPKNDPCAGSSKKIPLAVGHAVDFFPSTCQGDGNA